MMEFILLRLIQLSRRELGILNELCFNLYNEQKELVMIEDGAIEKERVLINELIQIERDKQEEYAALSRKMNCEKCITEEQLILKKMTQYTLASQDRLLQKLGNELLDIIKKISSKNTAFQIMVDEFLGDEVQTVSLDQTLPFLSSMAPARNPHSEVNFSISSLPSN